MASDTMAESPTMEHMDQAAMQSGFISEGQFMSTGSSLHNQMVPPPYGVNLTQMSANPAVAMNTM